MEGVSVSDTKTLQVRIHEVLWRPAALITSLFTQAFVTGGEILGELQARFGMFTSYLSSEIMQVACKWVLVPVASCVVQNPV